MAIVIKVKADTKELEKDIQAAAQNAKKTIDKATASAGTGATGINKISEEFKRQRTEAEALRGRVEELKKSSGSLSETLGASTVRWIAYGGAIAFAKKHTIDMVQETAKLNDELLEASLKTGKTAEKMQALVKGGRDLTGELRSLGAVLSFETIKKASEATDQFALLDKQLFAIQTRITAEMSDALQGLGRALNEAMERVGPIVVRMATQVGNGIESILPLLSRTLEILARINELQEKVGLPFSGKLGRDALSFVEKQFAAPPSRTETLDLTRVPTFAATGEFRDFLKSPITQERLLENRRRDRPPRVRAARADTGPNLPVESVDAIRLLNQVLSQLEENAKGAAAGIAAMNARTLQVLEGRARLRGQLEDIPTFTAEQAGLTTGVDDTRIRRQIQEAAFEEQFKVFEEVRQQAIRFKESIVFTFESAFREGFEKGPKAFLQATAAAIKSFFSQIAAELSTGIIEMILFGKGGITGRGVGTSGTLGGLGAALGGFGRSGASFAGFGGGGGGGGGGVGGFISSFFGGGGGGGTSIGVAPSLSGSVGGFSGFSGGFGSVSNAVAQRYGFGGAGAAGGGLLAGIGAFAGPALLGGLLGSGLGGGSTAGKILGGVGGALGGIAAFTGIAGALTGGVIGAVAGLAATGIGLIAAPLLIGAYFLGKAKQRKVDEQAADAIWVAEREQIRTLISAVNADRIEGYDALAQWSGIRSNTVAQLNQIKTDSVRQSRLNNQLRDLDNTVVAELRAAVERQGRRRGVSGMLVPEFEAGGRVPGVDRGYDSVMIKARPGEVVLNRSQQASIQARAGDRIFEEVGIQSFQYGGRVSAAPQVPQSLHLTISLEGDAQAVIGNLIVRGVETSSGQRAIVSVVKNGRKNGEL